MKRINIRETNQVPGVKLLANGTNQVLPQASGHREYYCSTEDYIDDVPCSETETWLRNRSVVVFHLRCGTDPTTAEQVGSGRTCLLTVGRLSSFLCGSVVL